MVLTQAPPPVSVSAYPSITGMPAAPNQPATSVESAALPETRKRIRPPSRARIFDRTSRSASAYWARSARPGGVPSRRARHTRPPTENAQVNSVSLSPPSASTVWTTAECTFSKIRGGPAMKVGRMIVRLSTILSRRPSTAVGNPICSCTASSIFPNECASGSHRYCRSSLLTRPRPSAPAPM